MKTRREFIKIVGLSGSGLFLAAYLPSEEIISKLSGEPKIFSPSLFIRIDEKGIVTVIVNRSEMGQGTRTSLPMLVAEELEVDLKNIRVEQADGDSKFGNQSTGGSWSIRRSFEPYRVAGATAREMLIIAAAAKWKVETSNCYAEKGFVYNKINKKKLSYGALVEDASKLAIPTNVKLKDPKDYKILGKPLHRTDTPEKLYGKAKFGIDIVLPGMYYAALERCPVFGGKVKSFNDAKAKKVNGVVDVFQTSRGVAVVANSTWSAFKGKQALEIEWDFGANTNVDSETIRKWLTENLEKDGTELELIGTYTEDKDEVKVESVYEVPFLSHAPMEAMNAVATVKEGKAELWVPSQNPQDARNQVAKILNLKLEDVTIHVTLVGGAFGRKLRSDYAIEAAEIAKSFGKPIKLTWTRKDDMKNGYFRPASMHKLKGAVANGKALRLEHHVIAPSIRAQDAGEPKKPGDFDIAGSTLGLKYQFPYLKISGTVVNTPVPISWYRAVYGTQNPFAVEAFVDELAVAAKRDPFEFRKELLPDSRLRNVLITAAEKSNWYSPLPKGKGRGIACYEGYGSYSALVAEVTVEGSQLKVDKYTCVIDCGIVVNPDTLVSQIEGSVAFSLSAALKSEITIKNGSVVQSNYDDYQILTLQEMPNVEVHIVNSTEKVGGIGELIIGPVPAALCNAIFNASGKRVRKLPISLS